jgi:hypothetical protein
VKTFSNLFRWLGAGPHPALSGSIGLVIFSFVLTGCVSSPNLLLVQMHGIKAQGSMAGQREQIEFIEISPQHLAGDQARDLWIDLTATRRVTMAEITDNLIKDASTSKFISSSQGPVTTTYYLQGYAFEFTAGCLVKFIANRYGFPPAKATAFVRLGSRKTGNSLSLPCSLQAFEQVFGKADLINHGFGW